MDTGTLVALVVIVLIVAVVAAVAVSVYRKKQTDVLRRDFGEEYDRAIDATGDQKAAERELRDRRKLHDDLELRPLTPMETDRFVTRWRDVQTRFVDEPDAAVADADALVAEVMHARGYDLTDLDTDDDRDVVDLVAVDHPDVVPQYRDGHRLFRRAVTGEGGTEDLRQAMVRFRSLFESLVDDGSRSRS